MSHTVCTRALAVSQPSRSRSRSRSRLGHGHGHVVTGLITRSRAWSWGGHADLGQRGARA
eukprot:2929217-Rhodomonas_salina.2